MKPFKKRRRQGTTVTFEAAEAHLLASMTGQVIELLRDRNAAPESDPDPLAAQIGLGGPGLPPDDPVLHRLLPDAYPNDATEAAEYRRLTERSLASVKVENAEILLASLIEGGMKPGVPDPDSDPVEVELDPREVVAWLKALNDIRLSLAVRLDIETEEDTQLIAHSADESRVAMGEIYDWLGFVQESLVVTLE